LWAEVQFFDYLGGISGLILDALKTDNDFLKRYIQERGIVSHILIKTLPPSMKPG